MQTVDAFNVIPGATHLNLRIIKKSSGHFYNSITPSKLYYFELFQRYKPRNNKYIILQFLKL